MRTTFTTHTDNYIQSLQIKYSCNISGTVNGTGLSDHDPNFIARYFTSLTCWVFKTLFDQTVSDFLKTNLKDSVVLIRDWSFMTQR